MHLYSFYCHRNCFENFIVQLANSHILFSELLKLFVKILNLKSPMLFYTMFLYVFYRFLNPPCCLVHLFLTFARTLSNLYYPITYFRQKRTKFQFKILQNDQNTVRIKTIYSRLFQSFLHFWCTLLHLYLCCWLQVFRLLAKGKELCEEIGHCYIIFCKLIQ